MVITSGPEQPSGRFLDCKPHVLILADRHIHSRLGLLLLGSLLVCCTQSLFTLPSVELTPDRQAILVTPSHRTEPSQLLLQSLPTESTLAPGLSYRPQRFELARTSPDRQYTAFSAVGHHTLIGLLDLSTMAVREIDVVTEGDVTAFYWSADSRTLAYGYLPASGYRRVKGYDVQSGERLVAPPVEGTSTLHIHFEAWGPNPREAVLQVIDTRSNIRRTETVTLIPRP